MLSRDANTEQDKSLINEMYIPKTGFVDNSMIDWNGESRRLLRAELARRGVTYRRLVELLAGVGVEETERSIANKVARGTFGFAFFLQCMQALGRTSVLLDFAPHELPGDNPAAQEVPKDSGPQDNQD